jgi:hypothetical protein
MGCVERAGADSPIFRIHSASERPVAVRVQAKSMSINHRCIPLAPQVGKRPFMSTETRSFVQLWPCRLVNAEIRIERKGPDGNTITGDVGYASAIWKSRPSRLPSMNNSSG